MNHCANCGAELATQSNFCQHCGQSTKNFKQPLSSFLKESFQELLDVDGRMLLTLKTLLFKPGLAAAEFAHGKRQKYTPPLRMYLIFSLVFFLVLSTFQSVFSGAETRTETTTELYSRIMFVLLPIYALYVGCLFRQSYYIANLVFAMHIHSVAYIVLLALGPLELLESKYPWSVVLQLLPAGYFVWYVLKAYKTMFVESWLATVVKSTVIYIVYMATLGFVFDVALA